MPSFSTCFPGKNSCFFFFVAILVFTYAMIVDISNVKYQKKNEMGCNEYKDRWTPAGFVPKDIRLDLFPFIFFFLCVCSINCSHNNHSIDNVFFLSFYTFIFAFLRLLNIDFYRAHTNMIVQLGCFSYVLFKSIYFFFFGSFHHFTLRNFSRSLEKKKSRKKNFSLLLLLFYHFNMITRIPSFTIWLNNVFSSLSVRQSHNSRLLSPLTFNWTLKYSAMQSA